MVEEEITFQVEEVTRGKVWKERKYAGFEVAAKSLDWLECG